MQKKLLIVDDDKLLQSYLASFLKEKNYLSEQLFSGEELEKYFDLSVRKPDLILLDVLMSGRNGFYWLEWLTEKHPMIPIIMLTGENKKWDRIFALSSGAVDYVNKPFDMDELLLRVQIMIRLYHNNNLTREGRFYFGSYCYDFSSKILHSHQGHVHLTENEKRLFLKLCENYGEVVSREVLSRAIGVAEFHPMDRRIDVHISRLRNKFKKITGKEKYIHVVRNKGYFLRHSS
ncbi:MAG TPA: response regulator transcription factor [Leucothrix mucor]|uniref:Response regulator transcription factor n=1 Tax=Leucothrix mucor TaxID=45248 RepID=A0A7V2T154_LEUMU|nr:response regulator transcription factor [Leucothrix mucor]